MATCRACRAGFYARAFVRAYAEAVGLDGELVVSRLADHLPPAESAAPPAGQASLPYADAAAIIPRRTDAGAEAAARTARPRASRATVRCWPLPRHPPRGPRRFLAAWVDGFLLASIYFTVIALTALLCRVSAMELVEKSGARGLFRAGDDHTALRAADGWHRRTYRLAPCCSMYRWWSGRAGRSIFTPSHAAASTVCAPMSLPPPSSRPSSNASSVALAGPPEPGYPGYPGCPGCPVASRRRFLSASRTLSPLEAIAMGAHVAAHFLRIRPRILAQCPADRLPDEELAIGEIRLDARIEQPEVSRLLEAKLREDSSPPLPHLRRLAPGAEQQSHLGRIARQQGADALTGNAHRRSPTRPQSRSVLRKPAVYRGSGMSRQARMTGECDRSRSVPRGIVPTATSSSTVACHTFVVGQHARVEDATPDDVLFW